VKVGEVPEPFQLLQSPFFLTLPTKENCRKERGVLLTWFLVHGGFFQKEDTMRKWMLATLCLTAPLACFSDVEDRVGEISPFQEDDTILLYTGYGLGKVLAEDYWGALEAFDNVFSLLQGNDRPEIRFLASFGRVVAYDNLGMQDHCERAMGVLFISLFEAASLEEEGDLEMDLEGKEFLQLLTDIASLAPTQQVRNILLELVEDMGEEEQTSRNCEEVITSEEAGYNLSDLSRPTLQKLFHHVR